MKKISYILFSTLLFITSCSDDENIIEYPEIDNIQLPIVTEEQGSTIINTKNMEVGNLENDIVFDVVSTIISPTGDRVEERTLNCCGMGAAVITNGEQDVKASVENVTIINKGVITVHTKDFVKRYIDHLQTPNDTKPIYKYLRIIVMYGGTNNTLINEGTINVYFDHDPTIMGTVYVMAMAASSGSSIINKGQINFYGNGSVYTRMRGIATFGDEITAINNGTMTAKVDMATDTRMITTGGTRCNVMNNGIMRMEVPGNIFCMTRYGDSNLINNNTIEIISTGLPEDKTNTNYFICGMYDALDKMRTAVSSPIINRGKIKVTLTDDSDFIDLRRQAFGIICELQVKEAAELEVAVQNEGAIILQKIGNHDYLLGEASFRSRHEGTGCRIKLGRWHTTLRDFNKTHDLFVVRGANINFTGGEIILSKGKDYLEGTNYSVAPKDLLFQVIRAGKNDVYEYTGYDNLIFKSVDPATSLVWNQEKQEVSLIN